MPSIEFTKRISFKCGTCQVQAKITVDDDLEILGVDCFSCGTSVGAEESRLMYDTLLREYREEEGRNFVRRLLNERGMARVPLAKVGNEFRDPRWPFILTVND